MNLEAVLTSFAPSGFDLILLTCLVVTVRTLGRVDKRLTEATPEDDKPLMPSQLTQVLEALLTYLYPKMDPKATVTVAKSIAYKGKSPSLDK